MNERMKAFAVLAVAFFAATPCAAEKENGSMPLKGIRFTGFTISSNAVSFTASLSPSRDLSERTFELFATQDIGAKDWKMVGSYDVVSTQTELVGKLQLESLPFPSTDRLFLALRPRVSDAAQRSVTAKRASLRGTTALLVDTDGDGLTDSFELGYVPALDPHNPDCDDDGYIDGEEILAGTSPVSHNNGAGATIRYYYDADGRLTGSYSGTAQAASASSLSSAGNPIRQTSR